MRGNYKAVAGAATRHLRENYLCLERTALICDREEIDTMGAGSSFPIDLILFGMIAAFLVLRLRSILGRRTGFERQAPPYQPQPAQTAAAPVIDGQVEPQPPATTRSVPDATSEAGQALARMRSVD